MNAVSGGKDVDIFLLGAYIKVWWVDFDVNR